MGLSLGFASDSFRQGLAGWYTEQRFARCWSNAVLVERSTVKRNAPERALQNGHCLVPQCQLCQHGGLWWPAWSQLMNDC
jgi:hypothetical protein